MSGFDWHIALTLAMLLIAALFAGGFAGLLRIPKVTAYLLAGVLVGPSVLNWVDHERAQLFEPLTKLAIALVLFNLGCHFPLMRARRILRRVLRLSVGDQAGTFLLVALGLMLVGDSWQAAILLGALAVATAPATTILVLKEAESEGTVTEYTNALVALNNLSAIVLFELLFLAIHFFEGKLVMPVAVQLRGLLQDVAGSVLLGVVAGGAVSYCYPLVAGSRRSVLLVAILTLLLAACQIFEMPYLLAFLAMGFTVANSSDQTRQIVGELDWLTGLLSVVFFVVHGAELELGALGEAGLIGVGYIVFRALGKYLGVRLTAQSEHDEPAVCQWLPLTLMAQAGAAIALSAIAARRDPELGLHLQTVILGTVVVFELLGPILIRHAVVRAGEVPLAHAIYHASSGPMDQLRTVWNRLLMALGFNPWKKRSAQSVTIQEIMRKNVVAVPQTATFDEVIRLIEHSRENTYPVVGATGELLGVIRYRELSSVLFDPALGSLVRAADVTTASQWILRPEDTIPRAFTMFHSTKDDVIPVVTQEKPSQLLGIVRRRDVLRMLIRQQDEVRESER